jgi:hypothetical protein
VITKPEKLIEFSSQNPILITFSICLNDLEMIRQNLQTWFSFVKTREFIWGSTVTARFIELVQKYNRTVNEVERLYEKIEWVNHLEKIDETKLSVSTDFYAAMYKLSMELTTALNELKGLYAYHRKQEFEKQLLIPESLKSDIFLAILEELKLPSSLFQYMFVTENVLRCFIIKILDTNGIKKIEGERMFSSINKTIIARKLEETRNNYLPVRGNHDVYYLDMSELNSIFINSWSLFQDKFPSQEWIKNRISSMYAIRVRVAHNSSTLTKNELDSIRTYSREILMQVGQYL